MKISLAVLLLATLPGAVFGGEAQKTEPVAEKVTRRAPVAALFDTGEPLPEEGAGPLKMEPERWTKTEGGAPAVLKGDAVLSNPYSAVVVRKAGTGVDLYAQAGGRWVHRARLLPLAGGTPLKCSGSTSVPGDGSSATVTVKLPGEASGHLELSLAVDSPLLKATPKGKLEGLRIAAPCRWGVLPDFFTDDTLVDAQQILTPQVELPIERVYLQLLAGGDSILSIFCDKNERDIRLSLEGDGEKRVVGATDVFFGSNGGNIWAGTLEHKRIWHCRPFSKEENQKGARLDWEVPFEAQWKGTFTQADGNVHSASMNPWITWAGTGPKKGVVQVAGDPARPWRERFEAEGPLLVYPLRRNDNTPLELLMLDDLMRLSLGSGPCAYILDVSGRKSLNRGIFTCSYDWTIPRMTSNSREDMNFYKEERVMLRHVHKSVLTFMRFIESRIGLYADFRKELLAMLEEREKKNPDLGEFIGKLKQLVSSLPAKAPAGSEAIAPKLKVVEKAILLDTPAQIAASLEAAKSPPGVAEPQDVQLAHCRRIAKLLRARATAEFVRNPALAKNPAAAEIVKEIREKSQAVLHGPASHEGGESW